MTIFKTFAHIFHPQTSNNHRPRILHPLGLVWLAILASSIVGFTKYATTHSQKLGDVLGFASSITAEEVLLQTNQQRQKNGLPPLVLSDTLSEAAVAKAQDMFDKQYWSHNSPEGVEPWAFFKLVGYEYRAAGENLARDFSTTPDMVAAWMKSPTHRANIINPKYTEIGLAVVDGELQDFETTLVVQLFGLPVEGAAEISDTAAQESVSVVEESTAEYQQTPAVLASALVAQGQIQQPVLFSPLVLAKSAVLAVALLVIMTLIYDFAIIHYRQTVRIVGKNLAHVLVLSAVVYLVLLFRSGVIL